MWRMTCIHDNAEPMSEWYGRYHCPDCGAICYKGRAMIPLNIKGGLVRRGPQLSAYICQVKGCRNHAVTKESSRSGLNKAWRCAKHRKKKECVHPSPA